MNLRDVHVSCSTFERPVGNLETHFLKMPRRILNLELSSGAFSTVAFAACALDGVPALGTSLELTAEAVVEAG